MTEVVFPHLDEETPDAQGAVATWFVDDGAAVNTGQLLAEVQVTKVSGDLTAPAQGVLRRNVAEGEVVTQGAIIGHIE